MKLYIIYRETTQKVTCSHDYLCSHGNTVEYVLECDSLNRIATHSIHYSLLYRPVAVWFFFYGGIYEVPFLKTLWPCCINSQVPKYTHISQCKLLQYFIHTWQQFHIMQQFSWNLVPNYTCRCLNTTTLNIKHKGINHVAWKGIKVDQVSTEALYLQDLDASAAQACLYTNPVECTNPGEAPSGKANWVTARKKCLESRVTHSGLFTQHW